MSARREELDVGSAEFCAYKALYSDAVSVPVASARPMDNLDAYDAARRGVRATHKKAKKEEEPVEIKRGFLPHQMPIPVPHRDLPNILTRMQNFKGPLAVLQECVVKQRRIKVWTRDMCKLRGVLTAILVAFDKHWNLALTDVDEFFVRKRRGSKVPATGEEVTSHIQKLSLDETEVATFNLRGHRDDPSTLLLAAPDLMRERGHRRLKSRDSKIIGKSPGWLLLARHVTQVMLRGEQIAVVVPMSV